MPVPAGLGVSHRLAATLAQRIATGALAPGARLVEAQLQADFAAGRSSVREALQQLAVQGLVTMAPNRGATVRRLSRTDVADLFAIRERLEGLGAYLAAQRLAAGAVPAREQKALAGLMRRLTATSEAGDALAYGQLNRELHQSLLALAGNAQLLRLVEQLSVPLFQQQFRGFLLPSNQRASQAQHQAIVAAVLAGRPAAAEAAMRRHVRSGLKTVLKFAPEHFGPNGD